MTAAIVTRGLSKRFGDVLAVDDVGLHVERGEIYAFLGLNGAGKSTTIRLLLGMLRPTKGEVTVLGEPIRIGTGGPWRRVGHVVDAPSAYPELSVRENIEIARRLQQVVDPQATPRIIAALGLTAYASRKAGTLSSGNLQRLGLARALLHRPELLVLDEPTSGLDPAGVVEIRELLRSLAADDGVTVFMSSHLLPEVDRLATRIGILQQGRLIEELDARDLERRRARRLVVDARDRAAARTALEAAGYTVSSSAGRDGPLALLEPRALEAPEDVVRALLAAGITPIHLAAAQEDLEAHFLRLIEAPS